MILEDDDASDGVESAIVQDAKEQSSLEDHSPKHPYPYFTCIKDDMNRRINDPLDDLSAQQPSANPFKLSFFLQDMPVYAIKRIPCGLESTADTALRLVRKESPELQRYMRDVYQKDDDKICKETGAIRFPCKDRWLKGEEYGFLIRHYFVYTRILKFHILSEKYHPNMVYERPEGKSVS